MKEAFEAFLKTVATSDDVETHEAKVAAVLAAIDAFEARLSALEPKA
jgi:hypothetical protein